MYEFACTKSGFDYIIYSSLAKTELDETTSRRNMMVTVRES